MTEFVYRAKWPILDSERPMSALRAEAAAQIDLLAFAAGARITGEVSWSWLEGWLMAEAPAVPIVAVDATGRAEWGSVAAQVDNIRMLASRRLTDQQIADVIGCSVSGVTKVRQRNGIPPGVGNPTLGKPEAA